MIRFILLFLLVGCNSNKHGAHADILNDSNYNKLIIRSPGRCAHVVAFDDSGKGQLLFGVPRQSSYYEEFDGFDTVLRQSSFKLDDKKQIDSIKIFIENIKTSKNSTGTPPLDAYRYELYVKGRKKVDVFGNDISVLNELIDLLSSHLPFAIDYACF